MGGTIVRLYVVRHGQTTSNVIHALDTALPGAFLTELGQRQAREAGQLLAESRSAAASSATQPTAPVKPVMVVCSQAARAQQTAALLAGEFLKHGGALHTPAPVGRGSLGNGVGLRDLEECCAGLAPDAVAQRVRTAPGIAEIPAGDVEMHTDHAAHETYHAVFLDWMRGHLGTVMPGARDGAQVLATYLATLVPLLRTATAEGCDLVVVTHGAVGRFVSSFLGRVDPLWASEAYLPNCRWIELEFPEAVVRAFSSDAEPTGPVDGSTGAGGVCAGEGVDVTAAELEGVAWVVEWGGLGAPPR